MKSGNDRISVFAQVKVDIVLEISSNTKHVKTVSKKNNPWTFVKPKPPPGMGVDFFSDEFEMFVSWI